MKGSRFALSGVRGRRGGGKDEKEKGEVIYFSILLDYEGILCLNRGPIKGNRLTNGVSTQYEWRCHCGMGQPGKYACSLAHVLI